jgi:hypothetical protein
MTDDHSDDFPGCGKRSFRYNLLDSCLRGNDAELKLSVTIRRCGPLSTRYRDASPWRARREGAPVAFREKQ